MLKLPKCLENDAKQKALEECLEQGCVKLWSEGKISVPEKAINDSVVKSLSFARRCGKLRGGLENIQTILQREEAGLVSLKSKGNESQTQRMSRLILMSDDGSERFYRSCESLLAKYGGRAFGIKLKASGLVLGEQFFGKDAAVKLIMVENQDFVAKVLLAFLD